MKWDRVWRGGERVGQRETGIPELGGAVRSLEKELWCRENRLTGTRQVRKAREGL